MTGKPWYGELYAEPGVRRSAMVWLAFGIPCIILSKLTWLESILWWLVLGVISLFIACLTVGIVLMIFGIDKSARGSPSGADEAPRGPPRFELDAGTALVASMTTWAIAWLLILSTLVPEHATRGAYDALWGLAGLGTFGAAVLMICAAISAVFRSSPYGLSGMSWLWKRVTGYDSFHDVLGGRIGLTLALLCSVAAMTGWLWLLGQAMRLALHQAGWSR